MCNQKKIRKIIGTIMLLVVTLLTTIFSGASAEGTSNSDNLIIPSQLTILSTVIDNGGNNIYFGAYTSKEATVQVYFGATENDLSNKALLSKSIAHKNDNFYSAFIPTNLANSPTIYYRIDTWTSTEQATSGIKSVTKVIPIPPTPTSTVTPTVAPNPLRILSTVIDNGGRSIHFGAYTSKEATVEVYFGATENDLSRKLILKKTRSLSDRLLYSVPVYRILSNSSIKYYRVDAKTSTEQVTSGVKFLRKLTPNVTPFSLPLISK